VQRPTTYKKRLAENVAATVSAKEERKNMSRVHWKNQFKTNSAASKFHNKVREIFATDPFFKLLSCWQELSVQELIPSYPKASQRFDWYIEELNTVVELHGGQHYHMVNYGNIGWDSAMANFEGIKERDAAKKWAAEEAGFSYKEIHYKHYPNLNGELLCKLILN
jgi:hypothetical protein